VTRSLFFAGFLAKMGFEIFADVPEAAAPTAAFFVVTVRHLQHDATPATHLGLQQDI
jgi:hypothetical protein